MQDTLMVNRYIERCDSATGWTVLGNDTTNLATTTRCVLGSAALEFDKVDGAANTKLAGAYRTVDLNLNQNDGGWTSAAAHDVLHWWVYCSSLAAVDYAFVRLGTDASNYVEFRYQDDEMTAGRFTHCAVPLGEYSARQGTGINWTNIDYMVIGVAFDAETDALADIAIDAVSIAPAAWAGNDVSFGDVDAEVTLDSEGIPDAAAPSHALQVGAVANASAPTPDEGDMGALSVDLNSQLRTRVDTAQAAHDAAAPADVVMAGAVANATADTPDEGDASRLSVTLNSELRTRLDLAQGVVDSAVPAQRVVTAAKAETTVPTAVADGDVVDLDVDEYGRQRAAGYDNGSDAIKVLEQSPAKTAKFGPQSFTQLTAAGSTAATNAENYSNVTLVAVVASLEAAQYCELSLEGSMDDSSYGNLSADDKDTRITANGTYIFRASNVAVKYVRGTMDTDSTGGAVTVDFTLMMGN
jgi:hypothetical protein